MQPKAVFGIASSPAQALQVVRELRWAGFSPDSVSVLYPDVEGSRDFAHEVHTKAPEGASAGAGVGGLFGAGLGWLAGIGALAIPGAGPFLAAGPLMAALSGAAIGASIGGFSGALVGLGIPELEARQYADKLKACNYLLSVHTESPDEVASAKRIFGAANLADVSTSFERRAPDAARELGDELP